MRGRKAHPSAIKLWRNNPGRRPLNPAEPKHEPIDAAVPPELTDAGAIAEWSRVIETLSCGHVTTVDRAALIGYCLKYGQWLAIEREAAKGKFITHTGTGYPVASPLFGMANKAYELMLKTAAELGLTPSSRSRVVLAGPDTSKTAVDEFTAFQRKRRRGA